MRLIYSVSVIEKRIPYNIKQKRITIRDTNEGKELTNG